MYVCMYVCMYTYMFKISRDIHQDIRLYSYQNKNICKYIYVYIYIFIFTYRYKRSLSMNTTIHDASSRPCSHAHKYCSRAWNAHTNTEHRTCSRRDAKIEGMWGDPGDRGSTTKPQETPPHAPRRINFTQQVQVNVTIPPHPTPPHAPT